MPSGKTFVGFGFGAIQGGLFLYEAFRSGNFDRLVVAEVLPEVVSAVRANGGYALNVATASGVDQHDVTGVEIYNPLAPAERRKIVDALAEAQEMATALPSVDFYDRGEASAANMLAEAVQRKLANPALPRAVLYAAENNNHAAEILGAVLNRRVDSDYSLCFQCLNTVIGKMSGVCTDAEQLRRDELSPMAPGIERAFLVEEFNRILITKIAIEDFACGLDVLTEKRDLTPFEEAKLYGHNAAHALLGYLANEKGLRFMSDAADDHELVSFCRAAFVEESGRALVQMYAGKDPLFTEDGYRAYVDDVMTRMLNPHLRDQVARVIRNPRRKLGWNDRLIGTMRLALSGGVEPVRYAAGARAALRLVESETGGPIDPAKIWPEADHLERRRVAALLNDRSS